MGKKCKRSWLRDIMYQSGKTQKSVKDHGYEILCISQVRHKKVYNIMVTRYYVSVR